LNTGIILRIEETISLILGRSPKQAGIVVRAKARARQVAMRGMRARDKVGSESDAAHRGSDGNIGHRFHSHFDWTTKLRFGATNFSTKVGRTISRQNRNFTSGKPRAQAPENEDFPDGVRLFGLADRRIYNSSQMTRPTRCIGSQAETYPTFSIQIAWRAKWNLR
jgi:hypothetical protein